MRHNDLDSFDRRLLAIVQRDASRTSESISGELGLSPSAVQRRLKRLRASGAIARVVAVLEPDRVGRPAFFVVGIEVDRERPEPLQRLHAWLDAEDAVQQVYYVTGSVDFMLVVVARDVSAYDALMRRLIEANPIVRKFTTNVVLRAGKRGLAVPVGEGKLP